MGNPEAARERGARVRALAALLLALGAAGVLRFAPWPVAERPCEGRVAAVAGEPERVLCATGGVPPKTLGVRRTLGLPVEVNALSQADFESLPGIGPTLARRIVDERRRRGGFRSLEEVSEVKGIGPAKLETLRRALHPQVP